MSERDIMDLKTYKVIETRLYGELLKACRRYSNDLDLISLLGILDLVKQEMSDLDKTSRTFSKTQFSKNGAAIEKQDFETIQ